MNTIHEVYSKIELLTLLRAHFPDNRYVHAAVRHVGEADSCHFDYQGTTDQFGIFYPALDADELTLPPSYKETLGEPAANVLLYQIAGKYACSDLNLLTNIIDRIESARNSQKADAFAIMVFAVSSYFPPIHDFSLSAVLLAKPGKGLRVLYARVDDDSGGTKIVYDPALPFSWESALLRAGEELDIIDPKATVDTYTVTAQVFAQNYLISQEGIPNGTVEVIANLPFAQEG